MSPKISSETLLLTGTNRNFRTVSAKSLAAESSDSFDTIIIDTSENNGIEAVREIKLAVSKKPYQSQKISVIILEADKLTYQAQNSLLKILEEPNDNCQLILTCANKDLLLPTVVSRLTELSLSFPKGIEAEKFIDPKLNNQSFGKQLEYIEKTPREDYLSYWANEMRQAVLTNNYSLKPTHHYNKLIIKMLRAEKGLVNRKLIDLILTLDIPPGKTA